MFCFDILLVVLGRPSTLMILRLNNYSIAEMLFFMNIFMFFLDLKNANVKEMAALPLPLPN